MRHRSIFFTKGKLFFTGNNYPDICLFISKLHVLSGVRIDGHVEPRTGGRNEIRFEMNGLRLKIIGNLFLSNQSTALCTFGENRGHLSKVLANRQQVQVTITSTN